MVTKIMTMMISMKLSPHLSILRTTKIPGGVPFGRLTQLGILSHELAPAVQSVNACSQALQDETMPYKYCKVQARSELLVAASS